MRIRPWLFYKRRSLIKATLGYTAPTEEELGYPPFTARIDDRFDRWIKKKQQTPLNQIRSKTGGQKWVRSLGLPTPEIYANYSNISELPEIEVLPNKFVLKPDSGKASQNVFVVMDGINLLGGYPVSRDIIVDRVGKEGQKPFIAEEFLLHHDGSQRIPNDVKFFCFGDQIALIMVIERNDARDFSKNRVWYLTEDWRILKMKISYKYYAERNLPEMPSCYPELRDMVRFIGSRINAFCRIDMYATSRGPVFGEFTFFPAMNKDINYTYAANAWLGKLWNGREGCGDREPRIEFPE